MTGGTIFGFIVIGIAVLTLAAWWLWMMGGEAPSKSTGGMRPKKAQRLDTHNQSRPVSHIRTARK